MTKRFINDIDIGQLIDTKGELSTIDYSDKVDFYELWEFLNKLNDENEQLKTDNGAFIQDIEVFKEENTHLKLENEQLKSELENCRECLELNRESCARHMKENEQLKSENFILKGKLHQLKCEKQEEEIECLPEKTIEKFKQDLREGNFIEFTAR